MSKHIIKYEYRDGVKLAKHEIEIWCGHSPKFAEWLFQDAQHAILSIEQESRIQPCKRCLKAIINTAENGLNGRCLNPQQKEKQETK